MARYDTAGEIIRDAMVEVGLTAPSDPVGSTDVGVVQFVTLLNTLGRQLVKAHPWEQLQREHSFIATAGEVGEYDLPADFDRLTDQTLWHRDDDYQAIGGLNAQLWQLYRASNISGLFLAFRRSQNKLKVLPTPVEETRALTYEYISRNWVAASGTQVPLQENIISSTDVILYDPVLVVLGLKYRWLASKGFDSSTAAAEFNTMLVSLRSSNVTAPIINMGRRRDEDSKLIDWDNVPLGGFGNASSGGSSSDDALIIV